MKWKVHIKHIYYFKFETKIIADNEQKTTKIGRVKVHSHDGQWRRIHSSLWMRPNPAWSIQYENGLYANTMVCYNLPKLNVKVIRSP